MICDNLAAGIAYCGKNWTKDHQIEYYLMDRKKRIINEKIDKILVEVYTEISKKGINKVLNKNNLKKIYDKYVYK